MKWKNVKKEERENWFAVSGPPSDRFQEAKQWCRGHPSPKHFYNYFVPGTQWWFEDENDALLFVLTFGV